LNRSLQQEQPSDSQPLILSFQDLMAREQALQAGQSDKGK